MKGANVVPPKPRITRDMILDAAWMIAREQGAESINARTIAERLNCSTQPVLYHFDHIDDIRREVYQRADAYHSQCLMAPCEAENPLIALGLNYIRFAEREKALFRLLFQSDSFQGQSLSALIDDPGVAPMLEMFRQEAALTMTQTKQVFRAVFLLVHGCASMLANNSMVYDEQEIVPMLETAFMGMVGAMKMEEMQE